MVNANEHRKKRPTNRGVEVSAYNSGGTSGEDGGPVVQRRRRYHSTTPISESRPAPSLASAAAVALNIEKPTESLNGTLQCNGGLGEDRQPLETNMRDDNLSEMTSTVSSSVNFFTVGFPEFSSSGSNFIQNTEV